MFQLMLSITMGMVAVTTLDLATVTPLAISFDQAMGMAMVIISDLSAGTLINIRIHRITVG